MSGISNEFNGTNEYVASEQLLNAVNVAITLSKPLLIKGEPGTGKTMLAEAVSKALGKKLIIWNIKSTTKAQDGLYMYDTIQRLSTTVSSAKREWMILQDISSLVSLERPSRAMSRSFYLSMRSTRQTLSSPTTFSGSLTRWNSTSMRPRERLRLSTDP